MNQQEIELSSSDYQELIEQNKYYVDKTGIIAELLRHRYDASLITRPRRFGKSMLLSMLRCFFEKKQNPDGTPFDPRPYFEGKKVMEAGDAVLQHMGQHPVLHLSFKNCGGASLEETKGRLRAAISNAARILWPHQNSPLLRPADRGLIERYLDKTCSEDDLSDAILNLCRLLFHIHQQKVILLIDEYDVPLNKAYHHGFFEPLLSLYGNLLSSALKENDALDFAVVTGCLRISQASIFTGLNNFVVYDFEKPLRDEFLGFTEEETRRFLADYGLEDRFGEVKDWYDGYNIAGREVYNPFSICHCISALLEKAPVPFKPYWIDTSSNDIVYDLIQQRGDLKYSIESLIRGEELLQPLYDSITYRDFQTDQELIWTTLYDSGYIKKLSFIPQGEDWLYSIAIVNREVKSIFQQKIRNWLRASWKANEKLPELFQAIWACDVEKADRLLNGLLVQTISYYDSAEAFYHGFTAGLFAQMGRVYSNREAGHGRADLLVYDELNQRGAVFEFKIAPKFTALSEGVLEAMKQIEQQDYGVELKEEGYDPAIAVAIAFYKKRCRLMLKAL